MALATRFGAGRSLMSPSASRRRQVVGINGCRQRSLSSGAGEMVKGKGRGCRRLFGPILGRRVAEAVANGEPVVALESTLITHGLPEPQNLEAALAMEREVAEAMRGECLEENGSNYAKVVPATVAIVRGQPLVGLDGDEIAYLANKQLSQPRKASRRDLAVAMARSLTAGTTVAGTMALLASLPHQPIRVFATGGLGGVHMGGQLSMDISADLYEMARSPLGLVSSGFKSFLDARRSLEYLETLGCLVMTLGSAQFPAFFRRHHQPPLESPNSVATPEEAARLLYWCLEGSPLLEGRAALLAVPIPDQFANSFDERLEEEIGGQIDKRTDLVGSQKTPLILKRLNAATSGRSLEANIGLLRNNARVGAQVAHEYALLRSRSGVAQPRGGAAGQQLETSGSFSSNEGPGATGSRGKAAGTLGAMSAYNEATKIGTIGNNGSGGQVLVVGATMIDMHVDTPIDDRFRLNPHHSGATFEGRPHMALGGVGRNLARALHLLGRKPAFITALARDNLGAFALDSLRHQLGRVKVSWWPGDFNSTDDDENPIGARRLKPEATETQAPSSCFALVLVDSLTGQCEYVVANLEACQAIDAETLERNLEQIKRAPLVVADANLPRDTTSKLLELCQAHQVPLFLEPTDVLALSRLMQAVGDKQLLCLSPNQLELERMLELLDGGCANEEQDEELKEFQASPVEVGRRRLVERKARRLMGVHLPHLRCLLVTMDSGGCLVGLREPATVGGRAPLEQARLLEQFRADPRGADLGAGRGELLRFSHFPVPRPIERPISASGAGDTFAAAFIAGLLDNLTIEECMAKAFEAAQVALEATDTIPDKLADLKR